VLAGERADVAVVDLHVARAARALVRLHSVQCVYGVSLSITAERLCIPT
jgi:hypothetical protein